MISFDPDSHTYSVAGVIVPSVTEIMGGLRDFGGIPAHILDAAASRGTDVHIACALADRDDLDESSISGDLIGYVDAWRDFTRREAPEWALIEQPLYDAANGYAGTPDRAGYVRDGYAVVEVKTTAQLHPSFGVQLAGYHRLVAVGADFDPTVTRRMVVQLKPNGTYRIEYYADPLDEVVFASCLAIHHWRKRHA